MRKYSCCLQLTVRSILRTQTHKKQQRKPSSNGRINLLTLRHHAKFLRSKIVHSWTSKEFSIKTIGNDCSLHVLEYKVLCCARPFVVTWNSKRSLRSVQALFSFLVCQMKRFLPRNIGSVMLEESIDWRHFNMASGQKFSGGLLSKDSDVNTVTCWFQRVPPLFSAEMWNAKTGKTLFVLLIMRKTPYRT